MPAPTLRGLLEQMHADMPRVLREQSRRKNQPHHKKGLNRGAPNDETDWMPAQWIVPTQGTNCGRSAIRLYEEPASD